MLDRDVGLPCILPYVIHTRTSLGYRNYTKSSNFEPVLYKQYNPFKSGVLGADRSTAHVFSDYYPVTAVPREGSGAPEAKSNYIFCQLLKWSTCVELARFPRFMTHGA